METNKDIKLIQYSPKCYVLTGPGTKEIKSDLKKLKLRWNGHLKTKDGTGAKFGGWLISLKKVEEIKTLFNINVSAC